MPIGILFHIITLLIIIILFVTARKAELRKHYKTSFALYILMVVVCIVLFLSAWG